MEEECLFCSLLSGKKHRNNYPFMPIHETERTISFLSIDFPKGEDGHTLVIPKKHYENIEDVPNVTQLELIKHVSLIAKIIRSQHGGCNILLNDGAPAEQTIMHTHFHLVPRDKDDGIEIELWTRTRMPKEKYAKLCHKFRKLAKKHSKKGKK